MDNAGGETTLKIPIQENTAENRWTARNPEFETLLFPKNN